MRRLFYAVLALFALACSEPDVSKITVDPGFSSYVSAFTSGVISGESTIKVVLLEAHASAQPGELINEKLFEFDPALDGEAFWLDEHTVEFRPTNRLKSGQTYLVKFGLSKLLDVPDQFETLEFGIKAITQNIYVSFDGLNTPDVEDFSRQELNGVLRTTDAANAEDVQACFTATQQGKSLPVSWEHLPGANTHKFTVQDVIRKEEAGEVLLAWDGEKLGIDMEDELPVRIPPLGEFTMLKVNVERSPGVHFAVQFSDPLDAQQDLVGLIYLESGIQLKLEVEKNVVRAYPEETLTGKERVVIDQSIINVKGYELQESYVREVEFHLEKPAIELIGEGTIIPSSGQTRLPFRAINLKAVNLQVIRIFEKNVPQFLQVNELDGSREMSRVGRLVANKEIELTSDEGIDYGVWNDFAIDLNSIIAVEPGAIYRVSLSFLQHHSLYPCANQDLAVMPTKMPEQNFDDGSDYQYYNDYHSYYDYSLYDYNERDNPCHPSYYMHNRRSVQANLLASNLGMIAKGAADNSYEVLVTDLISTAPMSGIEVEAYNFQNRKVGSGKTNGDGLANIQASAKPYLLIAKIGKQRGYLRVDNGSALNQSLFEVGGVRVQKGLKGFLYGERGVWRPGDTVHLAFMMEDLQKAIPKNHPVVMELFDPQGNLQQRKVSTNGVEGLYRFDMTTDPKAITGNWKAKATVGNNTFYKSVKIETIKPNRLKIDYDTGELLEANAPVVLNMNASWLYGAKGDNLKARVEMEVENMNTTFEDYPDYQFDDRTRKFRNAEPIISEGKTNGDGAVALKFDWNQPSDPPGMLKVKFSTKVFEPGGDFSQDFNSAKYSPYETYVGLKISGGKSWRDALDTETAHGIAIAAVDQHGESITRTVNVELYKLNWNWWWESRGGNDMYQYIRRESSTLLTSETFKVEDGKGMYELNFPEKGYGRYLLRVVDPVSGHAASQQFFAEYPGWWNNSEEGNEAASMLVFTPKKKHHNVGDDIELSIPSGGIGRMLITVEKGDRILDRFWVEAASETTPVTIKATEEMAPNVYVSAMLIQPHAQDENSLPIRMFGVTPVMVSNASSRLQPEIEAPEVLAPESTFEVTVSERDGHAMAYTIAVVDEGLLGLTRFKTPDPWSRFYSKEALGVKTWDLYKHVIDAETGKMAGLLAVGGDEALEYKEEQEANRFKPVVKFLGPFFLNKRKEQTHEITLPNYIGAVRVMVVAGYEGAYGSAEKELPVRQPLMVMPTLPRVLGPSERVRVPVSVISMDDKIKSVKVSANTNDLLKGLSPQTKTVTFKEQGEQLVYFEYEVAKALGVAEFSVTATGSGESAKESVEIQVRPPNPPIANSNLRALEPGESWKGNYQAIGIKGTNKTVLQVTKVPDLNLEKHLEYLIRYPHGCIEQTTSAVFPQLFLNSLIELSAEQKGEIDKNIVGALNRYRQFQTSEGGFTYWPNHRSRGHSLWGTNYAGHFLVEAKNAGYDLPPGLFEQWKKFQKNQAASWSRSRHVNYGRYGGDLTQAYRLYTLALAGAADVGAMNRLRNDDELSKAAAFRLAAAYAVLGRNDVAKEMIKTDLSVTPYREMSYSYGSGLRDMGMMLETLHYLEDDRAPKLLLDVAKGLSVGWHSTQTRAYCLMAIAKYVGGDASGSFSFEVELNGNQKKMNVDQALYQWEVDAKDWKSGTFAFTNTSSQMIFVSVEQSGIPLESDEIEVQEDLNVNIVYRDMNGKLLDINKLVQGQDFKAMVTVNHPGLRTPYKEVALSQLFPSGWQIVNKRVGEESGEGDQQQFTYRDIRDDRVYTYFDLDRSKTKTFEVLLNATFVGRYYRPAVHCAPMYDERIKAVLPGGWVEVVSP